MRATTFCTGYPSALIDYMFQTGNIEQAEKLIDQLHGLLEELPDSMQEPYNARIVAIRQAQN